MASLTVRIRRHAALVASACMLLLGAAVPAAAQTLDEQVYWMRGSNVTPAASYVGWSYVSASTPVTAWKWSSTGWQQTSFVVGASAWAHSWTDTWMWAYRDSAWYAVHRADLRTWSCAASPTGTVTLTRRTAAMRYNASSSQVLGYLAAGTPVKLGCGNAFADAQPEPPGTMHCMAMEPGCWSTSFVLVYANPLPACLVPVDPNGIRCMIAVRDDPKWVYVPTTAFNQFVPTPNPLPLPLPL